MTPSAAPAPFRTVCTSGGIQALVADLLDETLDRPQLLDVEERERAGRIRFDEPRRRFLRSRAGLRLVLARQLGLPPESLIFETGRHGKPRLAAHQSGGLCFNLSHSGDRLIVAMAKGREIGVDLEMVDRAVDVVGVAGQVFTVNERADLADLTPEEQRALFFRLWTRKEALLKATGDGFVGRPQSFSIPAHLRAPHADGALRLAGRYWRLLGCDAGKGTEAALAVEVPREDAARR